MSMQDKDGYVELEYNSDRTQALATIHPPSGDGAQASVKTVMDRLVAMGVIYGMREDLIENAIRRATLNGRTLSKVVVAQGVVPQAGIDAKVCWKLDPAQLQKPYPKQPNGNPDFFAYDPKRLVKAGQAFCTVVPSSPGTPGKTLTAPLTIIRPEPGREANITAGTGVKHTDDRLTFVAAVDGFPELRGDTLMVHAFRWIAEDLQAIEMEFAHGAIINGSVRGGKLVSNGDIAIKGSVAGATIRSRGDIFISAAARSTIMADGNIYVSDRMLNCEVNTRRKLIGTDNSTIYGGKITASEGITAVNLGSPEFTETQILCCIDTLSGFRLDEVEEEIRICEENVNKIAQAIRPLTSIATGALTDQKLRLVNTLKEQRRSLEMRVHDLHNEKRTLLMGLKNRYAAVVSASGKVHPGVCITLGDAACIVEETAERTAYMLDPNGRSILTSPFSEALS